MTTTCFRVNTVFKEDRWFRMMFLSFCFHLVIFSLFLFFSHKKIYFPSIGDKVYHVELVELPSGVERGTKGKGGTQITERREKFHTVKTQTRRIAPKKKKAVTVVAKRVSSKPIARKQKKDDSVSELVDKAISKIEKKVKKKRKIDGLEETVSRMDREVNKGITSQSGKNMNKGEGGTQPYFKEGKGGFFGMSSGIGKGIQIYQMKIEDAIKSNWSYPVAVNNTSNKQTPEAIIIITVRRDGKILKAWFRKRSNNSLFDDSVLKAVKRSDPLPEFPPGYLKSYDEIEINFSLKDLIQQ